MTQLGRVLGGLNEETQPRGYLRTYVLRTCIWMTISSVVKNPLVRNFSRIRIQFLAHSASASPASPRCIASFASFTASHRCIVSSTSILTTHPPRRPIPTLTPPRLRRGRLRNSATSYRGRGWGRGQQSQLSDTQIQFKLKFAPEGPGPDPPKGGPKGPQTPEGPREAGSPQL